MTQETTPAQSSAQTQSRARGRAKSFPPIPFEQALELPKSILQHGVNGEVQRLTILDKMGKSPGSSMTRTLISSSYRYGLTTGNYKSTDLTVTADGQEVLSTEGSIQERKDKQFELAIRSFDSFNNLYERLKDQRFPDATVLRDELGRFEIAESDRQRAAEVFTANIQYIGLVDEISGQEYVRPIEHIISQTQADGSLEDSADDQPTRNAESAEDSALPVTSERIISGEPTVHIDIQVHIDSSATVEQIEQIFASMAKHLYRR